MGAGIDRKTAERKRRALEKKYGEPYRILRASNGEVAIMSVRYIESCNPTPIRSAVLSRD